VKFAAFLSFLTVVSGCASITAVHDRHGVTVENGSTPIETVVIENTGWKLFGFLPIGSGNPDKPNRCSCRLFEDTTTVQNNMDMLAREMKSVGATRIVNLTSKTIDESVFVMLFTRTACRTSAVLLK
jgi:hypothetical protein